MIPTSPTSPESVSALDDPTLVLEPGKGITELLRVVMKIYHNAPTDRRNKVACDLGCEVTAIAIINAGKLDYLLGGDDTKT